MKMVKLGEIVEFVYGKALKKADRETGCVPVVGSSGVIDTHERGFTSGPTIVVGRKGSIGSVTWIDGPAWPIDTAYYVNFSHAQVDPRWAYWLLKQLGMENMNKSAAVPGLNRDDVYRLSALLPPLDEQRRIAAILDKADAIRQKRRQAIDFLGSLSDSMLENQFLGDSSSTTTYALGDLLRSISTGKSPKCRDRPAGTDEWGVLKLSAITSGKFEPTENKSFPGAVSEIEKYEVRPGDLLFTRKNTPELVGTATLITSTPPRLAFPDLVFRLEVFEDLVSPVFLQALLMSSTMRTQVRELAVGTSKSMSNISGSRLRGLTIALPSFQRQLQFEQFQRKVLSATHRCSELLDRDNELFRSLQSRAFRGEL